MFREGQPSKAGDHLALVPLLENQVLLETFDGGGFTVRCVARLANQISNQLERQRPVSKPPLARAMFRAIKQGFLQEFPGRKNYNPGLFPRIVALMNSGESFTMGVTWEPP